MIIDNHAPTRSRLSHGADERTALLEHESDTDSDSVADATSQSPDSLSPEKLKWLIWTLVGVLVLIFEAGSAIRLTPLIAAYKDVLCNIAKPSGPCSDDHAVTSELAIILGVHQFLACLPPLLVSGLYGSMADKYGRRPVLFRSCLGMCLNSTWTTGVAWLAPAVPPRLIWVGNVFDFIGGGSSVAISILMTSAADIAPPTQRLSVFSLIHGTAIFAAMLGSAAGSGMMVTLGNYPPVLTGLGLMYVALFLSLLLPKTNQIGGDGDGDFLSEARSDSLVLDASSLKKYTTSIKGTLRATSQSFHTICGIGGAIPLLTAGFLSMIGQQVQILILQYMPDKFNISFAAANTFNIVNYAVNLLMLFVVVPLVSTLLLRRYGYTTSHKDFLLAHITTFLSVAGASVLCIAPNIAVAFIGIVIFGTGIGLSSLIRTIFVELFPPERAAFATSLISATKAIGGSLSGPIYSYAFALSLDWNGIFQGLPFLVSAICFVIIEFLLIATKAKAGKAVLNAL